MAAQPDSVLGTNKHKHARARTHAHTCARKSEVTHALGVSPWVRERQHLPNTLVKFSRFSYNGRQQHDFNHARLMTQPVFVFALLHI